MSSAAKGKSRLGRGLSSLISVSELPVEAEVPVEPPAQIGAADLPPAAASAQAVPAATFIPIEIRTDSILPNPHQPRKQFDEAGIIGYSPDSDARVTNWCDHGSRRLEVATRPA